jgi:release factor glutamine methyltransferase
MTTVSGEASLGSALRWGTARLAEAGVETPEVDARLLLAEAAKLQRIDYLVAPERRLSQRERQRFHSYIARRAARRPVSRLLGRRGFWSLDLAIDDSVLDPRPESESLVEAVLRSIDDRAGRAGREAPYRLLDLGVGSGCLLLALLAELPAARGTGVDLSSAAVVCARSNARNLGFASRASFLVGDWGRALRGGFDIIVSNPPYIPEDELPSLAPEVREHDPRAALAGGVDGLGSYRRMAPDVARLLAPDGLAVVECGRGQSPSVVDIFTAAGTVHRQDWPDLGGETRCISVTASHLDR